MTDIEQAARAELSELLMTIYDHGTQPNALREADAILAWLAEYLLSDDNVEKAARAIRDFNWPDYEDREAHPIKDYMGDARAALAAVLGKDAS